jgi:hypothetical protein
MTTNNLVLSEQYDVVKTTIEGFLKDLPSWVTYEKEDETPASILLTFSRDDIGRLISVRIIKWLEETTTVIVRTLPHPFSDERVSKEKQAERRYYQSYLSATMIDHIRNKLTEGD